MGHSCLKRAMVAVALAPATLARTSLAVLTGAALLGVPLYLAAPRQDVDISTTTLPLSIRLPLPDNLDSRVRAAGLLSAAGSGAAISAALSCSGVVTIAGAPPPSICASWAGSTLPPMPKAAIVVASPAGSVITASSSCQAPKPWPSERK